MLSLRSLRLTLLLLLSVPVLSFGQEESSTEFNVNKQGVLIDGYDVVSYFLGSVQKGKSTISVEKDGVNYWFSTEENKEIFLKNPEKFIPAYGGWCAYAMGDNGKKVKIDPETYKILDSRLYLFYNFYFNNTLIDWNKNEKLLRENADLNWQKVVE